MRGGDQQGFLWIENEDELNRAFDAEVSIVLPTAKVPRPSTPPVTHTELLRSPYRKDFEHSQRVAIVSIYSERTWLACFPLRRVSGVCTGVPGRETYIRLPPGCGERSGRVVKVLKCQYGLKQACREYTLNVCLLL